MRNADDSPPSLGLATHSPVEIAIVFVAPGQRSMATGPSTNLCAETATLARSNEAIASFGNMRAFFRAP